MMLKNLRPPADTIHESADPNSKVLAMGSTSISALEGRQRTYDDTRIIETKLDEVHDGKRYLENWSDEKIASHFCIPRKWVTEVREFTRRGPDINEQTSLLADMHNLLARMDEALATLNTNVEMTNTLRAERMQLEGRLGQFK
jgi:hypothetical protein